MKTAALTLAIALVAITANAGDLNYHHVNCPATKDTMVFRRNVWWLECKAYKTKTTKRPDIVYIPTRRSPEDYAAGMSAEEAIKRDEKGGKVKILTAPEARALWHHLEPGIVRALSRSGASAVERDHALEVFNVPTFGIEGGAIFHVKRSQQEVVLSYGRKLVTA